MVALVADSIDHQPKREEAMLCDTCTLCVYFALKKCLLEWNSLSAADDGFCVGTRARVQTPECRSSELVDDDGLTAGAMS